MVIGLSEMTSTPVWYYYSLPLGELSEWVESAVSVSEKRQKK